MASSWAWLPAAVLLLATTHAVAAASGIQTTTEASVIRPPAAAARYTPGAFREAPAFRNGDACASSSRVHIAMTLDATYLRGTVAAVFSILRHAACPEDITFHFLAAHRRDADAVRATFPYLDYRVHRFDPARVSARISRSVRTALDQPLNYARIYLADMLPRAVARVIYLDSDLVVVDDIHKLWSVDLAANGHVVAAPEYCHTNFTKYFTDAFWSDANLSGTFRGRRRRPCYFNTGVMVMDVARWRAGGYSKRVEEWMAVQKEEKRIYRLQPRLPAAVPAGARRGDHARGPPLEPARPRRGQRRGEVPEPPPGPHQPAALERQGQAVAQARLQEALRRRPPLGAVRPLQRRHRARGVSSASSPPRSRRCATCRDRSRRQLALIEMRGRSKSRCWRGNTSIVHTGRNKHITGFQRLEHFPRKFTRGDRSMDRFPSCFGWLASHVVMGLQCRKFVNKEVS